MKKITREYELYTFDELPQEAKDKARMEYNKNNEYPFLSSNMEDELEYFLSENEITDLNEPHKPRLCLYYSLSYCQGDGVMFYGKYEWKGYNISIKHVGHYYHSYSNTIDITDKEGNEIEDNKILEEFETIYQDICGKLEKFGYSYIEYEDSEECFREKCEANGYTFLLSGKMMNE